MCHPSLSRVDRCAEACPFSLVFLTCRTKIEKEKKEHAKLHGMIRTEISGAEIAEEMEKERRFFQLQMCEVRGHGRALQGLRLPRQPCLISVRGFREFTKYITGLRLSDFYS